MAVPIVTNPNGGVPGLGEQNELEVDPLGQLWLSESEKAEVSRMSHW